MRLLTGAGARRERLLALAPYLAFGLLLLLLWSTVLIVSAWQKQRLLTDTLRDLGTTGRATAEQTQGVLRDAETGLRMVDLWLADAAARAPAADAARLPRLLPPLLPPPSPPQLPPLWPQLSALTDTLHDASRGMVTVMLATPSGVLYRLPASGATPSASLGAQPAMDALMTPGSPRVLLGDPVKLSPIGARMLPLIMRLRVPLGELTLAVALVDLERLGRIHAGLARAPGGSIGLLRPDGMVLSRVPELTGLVGRNIFERAPDERSRLAGESGAYTSASSLSDGAERLIAYQHLEGLPVYAVASQSTADALVTYEPRRAGVMAGSAAISVAALVLTVLLARVQRRARLCEAELAATMAASPLALFRTDAHGDTTDANDAYLRLHGLANEPALWGRPPLLDDADRDAMARGETLATVRAHTLPDGRRVMLALRTAPLRVGGTVVGHAGTLQDVTEPLAHEQAQRTLTAIFDATPDCIVQLDPQGALTGMNRQARQRLGLSPMGVIEGLRAEHFHPAESMHRLRTEAFPQAAATGRWSGRVMARAASGSEMPFDETVLVHRGRDGRIEAISAILRDASAEIERQQQLARSEAIVAALAQSPATMITVLDRELRLRYMNRAAERAFGLQDTHWLGRPLRDVLGEPDFLGVQPLLESALRGEPASLHKRYAGGLERRVFNVQYVPLRTPVTPGDDTAEGEAAEAPEGGSVGAIDGVIGIADDITDARHDQRRLRDPLYIDELTQLLNQRGFERRADELIARARQDDSPLALLRLTLIRDTPADETPGHPSGEPMRRAFAGRLRHALRPQDVAARLGGDDFAVLLPGLRRAADADAIAQRLGETLGLPYAVEQHRLTASARVGLVFSLGGEAARAALMADADTRLQEATHAGPARVSRADPTV